MSEPWVVPHVPPPMTSPAWVPARASRDSEPRRVERPPGSAVARAHPFAAPICPEVTATALSEAPDFESSLATLRGPEGTFGRAVRFGASLGERRVVYVGHNPWLGSPAVWLSDGPGLCQTLLRRPPSAADAARRLATARTEPADARRELTSLVERLDEDSFRIDRRLLHLALGDAGDLDPALRGVGGRLASDGFRLARVPRGSLPAVLGLREGDQLVAINGRAIGGPQGLVAAYAELQRAAPATLTVVRAGHTVRLRYTFD